jgi:23S rRNA maturation mini-RNase III
LFFFFFMTEEEKRSKAWIGDAVLALFAREWILRQSDISSKERAGVFIHMTSNQFLSSLGEPTAMEAEIGWLYENNGLAAAFAHIEQKFLPVFLKQQKKRKSPGSYRNKRS